MRAMVLTRVASLAENERPLELRDLPDPVPGRGEVRLRIAACGVCHTELDEIEGRLPPTHLPIVLGHEIVGYVDRVGPDATKWKEGDRLGVGWIHHSSGEEDENIAERFRATGRDENGGYAERMTVPEEYAYAIPTRFSDTEAAPLLCAGAIGFRALRLANLKSGQRLGLTGFGGSAHLVAQLVRHILPDVELYVFARDEAARSFARDLGAVWAGSTEQRAPQKLHAIIDTTPAWKPVVEAMANLEPGGRLVINAIRKEETDKDYLQRLSYHEHLWMEREIKTVANITHYDIRDFLQHAADVPLHPEVTTYDFTDANRALLDLKRGPVKGAKVLVMDGGS